MKTSAGKMWISCWDLKKKRQKYSNIFLFIQNYLKIIICGNRLGVWRLVHLVAGFEKKNQTLFIKTHNLFAHTRVTELVLLNILLSSQLDLEIDQILSLFWDGICLSNIIIIIFLFFTIVFIDKTIIIITIIITRPKPAYGRQGLAGLRGQDTDQAGTFWGIDNISLRAFSAQLR